MVSAGQYGHLRLRAGCRAILCTAFWDSTCPHGNIRAGLPWSVCSRDTGQAKMVWNTKSEPSSIGTGSCSLPVTSCRQERCLLCFQQSTLCHLRPCEQCTNAGQAPENGWP